MEGSRRGGTFDRSARLLRAKESAMPRADWTDLEVLGGALAEAQSRLTRARSTQNHGLAKALDAEIAAAESLGDRWFRNSSGSS